MYEPSKLFKSFLIAGFQHYDGPLVLDRLEVGTPIDLVPERDNPHDPDAIKLSFEGAKLGYVPASDNDLLSLLAFYGHADVFEARVVAVRSDLDPWKQVRVGIYIADRRPCSDNR